MCGQCSAYVLCAGHEVHRTLAGLRSLLGPFAEENKSYSAAVDPTTIPRSSSPLFSHYIYPDSTNATQTEQGWLRFRELREVTFTPSDLQVIQSE